MEALCKDLGRPHDDYSRKLEKLRRSQPAPAATGAGTATRTSMAPQQQTANIAPQRSERPKPDRPSQSNAADRAMTKVEDSGR